MKNTIPVLLLLGALFSACSTELDVNADWEEKTIVYSIIKKENTAHYIRIHKAYLDAERGALEVAPIKDSLYYSNLDVRIVIEKPNNTTDTLVCEQVDTNALGGGIFAYPDQVLYRFYTTNTMDSTDVYRLLITTPNGSRVESSFSPVGGFGSRAAEQSIFPPRPYNPVIFTGLNWSSNSPFLVSFRGPRNARSWDLTLRIVYNEWPTNGSINDSVRKVLDWPLVRRAILNPVNRSTPSSGQSIEQRIAGRDLFAFMAANIPVDPNLSRRMRGVSFHLSFTDEPLTNFLTLNTSSQSAIDVRPEYTNITNGLGIFGTSYELPPRTDNPYDAFSYRQVEGGRGTDSLRARYPQLNFVP